MSNQQNSAAGAPAAPNTAANPAVAQPSATLPAISAMNPAQANAALAIQQQQQQSIYRMIISGQLTPEMLSNNPPLAAYATMIRSQIAAQTMRLQQAILPINLPTTTAANKPTGTTSKAADRKSSQSNITTTTNNNASTLHRKRKADNRLPDKSYHILPESPLFVQLQDMERQIDASIAKKKAEINESLSAIINGAPIDPLAAGSVRKKLRMYIFSEHFNQHPKNSLSQHTSPQHHYNNHSTSETPYWVLSINGRTIDGCDDSSHPGGGGTLKQGLHTPKYHFSSYIRSITVTCEHAPSIDLLAHNNEGTAALSDVDKTAALSDVDKTAATAAAEPMEETTTPTTTTATTATTTTPAAATTPPPQTTPKNLSRRVYTWKKSNHDREPVDTFQIRYPGDKNATAHIDIEIDYSPQLYTIPLKIEKLLNLPSGPAGGLYSITFLLSSLWRYIAQHDLFVPGSDRHMVYLDAALCTALGLEASVSEKKEPKSFLDVQNIVYKILKLPKPLHITHSIDVEGPSPGQFTCIDAHLEVAVVHPDAEPHALKELKSTLDQKLDHMDHTIASFLNQYQERKRRHAVLSGFSVDPYSTAKEIVMAHHKEVRVTKDVEHVEVMNASDVYKEKWTQDAALKYLTTKRFTAAVAANVAKQQQQHQQQQQQMMMGAQLQFMQNAAVLAQQQQLAAGGGVNVGQSGQPSGVVAVPTATVSDAGVSAAGVSAAGVSAAGVSAAGKAPM